MKILVAVVITALVSWGLGFQYGVNEVILTTSARIRAIEAEIPALKETRRQTDINVNSIATVVAACGEMTNRVWTLEQIVHTYLDSRKEEK